MQKAQPSGAAEMHVCTLRRRTEVKTSLRVSNYVLAFECAGKADDVSKTSANFCEEMTQKVKAQPFNLQAKC